MALFGEGCDKRLALLGHGGCVMAYPLLRKTVGELLEAYLGSAQLWKPPTVVSHRHVVSNLAGDPPAPVRHHKPCGSTRTRD
jgi:hypothetical protein